MKQIIDLSTWERRDSFNFFKDFMNPYTSVTSEVECGKAKQEAKERGHSFFLYYLYAILRAVNEIKELRYRIDNDGRILLYDVVNATAPIRVGNTDRFYSVVIPWNEDFNTFYDTAYKITHHIPESGNPFSEELEMTETGLFNMVVISALPDLYFTSISCTQKHSNGSDFPLITVGKAITRDGKMVMPVNIAVHHGFVDGIHLSRFFKLVEEFLN